MGPAELQKRTCVTDADGRNLTQMFPAQPKQIYAKLSCTTLSPRLTMNAGFEFCALLAASSLPGCSSSAIVLLAKLGSGACGERVLWKRNVKTAKTNAHAQQVKCAKRVPERFDGMPGIESVCAV